MPSNLLAPLKAGDQLSVQPINELIALAKSARGFSNGFVSSSGVATRSVYSSGSSGPQAIYGLIVESIVAGGATQNAIKATQWVDGVYELLLDAEDEQVWYGGINMNRFTNIVIFEDPDDSMLPVALPVWGFPREYNFGTAEVPDVQVCMEIWNPPFELAMFEGFTKNPANGVGQVPLHKHGVFKTIVDGSPCGGA